VLYLGLKYLHIVAVVLFLGNITTGLFWKFHADRTRDPRLIEAVIRGIIRSDRWFTIPGVVAITLFGILAAIIGHHPLLHTGWILWSIVLFSISGGVFMSQVARLQTAMARLVHEGVERGSLDWDAYHALSRRWEFWGAVALIAPAVAMALMVLKPALPAL
jgi:uncharacterized membrane protein